MKETSKEMIARHRAISKHHDEAALQQLQDMKEQDILDNVQFQEELKLNMDAQTEKLLEPWRRLLK
jgi:hypothetical protein